MTSSEKWRAECEARHAFALRRINPASETRYLEAVAKKRGQAASDALRDAASALWADKPKRTT